MVDTLITLYEHNETAFSTNGLGSLSDAVSCQVREERNGEYELTMEYPITGIHYEELKNRRIIFCKPTPYKYSQPFRIYNIAKPLKGIVTVSAHHISYDLAGYPIQPFKADSLVEVVNQLDSQMINTINDRKPRFRFYMRYISAGTGFELLTPCSARLLLGGSEGSILDHYHVEYEWDRFNVNLYASRGVDRGTTIEYGKNLIDLTQEENCEEVWTAVYPFWYSDSEDGGLVELGTGRSKIIQCPGTYDHERIYILDLSSEFTEKPTVDQLRQAANNYISEHELGSPKVSLTVSFVPLEDTVNYEGIGALQTVELCDTVRVYFPALNVYSTSKCIATTYNVLTNKYIEIELGDPKSDLASTVANQGFAMNEFPTTTLMTQIVEQQTKTITGNRGGFFIIHDSDGDTKPDECLWMDTDSIATAKKILRINKSGIGFSANGYNGPYDTAWTLDGIFNAKYIQAGTMSADRIQGGTLTLGGSSNGNGVIKILNSSGAQIGKIDNTGLYFGPNNQFYVDNNGNGVFQGNVYAKNIQVGTNEGYISSGQIGSGEVKNDNIGGSAVTRSKIGEGAVNSEKLAGNAVTNEKLQNQAVSGSKIDSNSVSEGHLDANLRTVIANVGDFGKIFAGSSRCSYMKTDNLDSSYSTLSNTHLNGNTYLLGVRIGFKTITTDSGSTSVVGPIS